MKKIVTIWWGNGHSYFLKWFIKHFWDEFELSSIVSMSDDWRTTWELMRLFSQDLGLHFPPPWDLRKCLYSSSSSKFSKFFKNIFENVFSLNEKIFKYSIKELFQISSKEYLEKMWQEISWEFSGWAKLKLDSDIWENEINDIKNFIKNNPSEIWDFLKNKFWEYFNFKLPLNSNLKWHKFGNILMWSLYYNLDKNYSRMMSFMHELLEVSGKIIPVTMDKAYIKAILANWEIIEKQDNIANLASYNSRIKEIKLLENSLHAKSNSDINKAILWADFIIIPPWDLYTSNIANLIIAWVTDLIKYSKAEIIYIWNSTNKWWETNWFKILDFILELEKYLWKEIDFFIANNTEPKLNFNQRESLENNISVRWWQYILIEDEEKEFLKSRWTEVFEWDLIDISTLYRHDNEKLAQLLEKIIF